MARWEWPPWLLLTAFGRDHILSTDTLLRAYPSTIPERDCRFFDKQPFARCRVVFYYEDRTMPVAVPIGEEFVFNDAGEMTIEAWSDLLVIYPCPMKTHGRRANRSQDSTRIPGLGTSSGRIDLDSDEMSQAALDDADIADSHRANNWLKRTSYPMPETTCGTVVVAGSLRA